MSNIEEDVTKFVDDVNASNAETLNHWNSEYKNRETARVIAQGVRMLGALTIVIAKYADFYIKHASRK